MSEVPQRDSLFARVPWLTFLLLTAVFLVDQDWYASQWAAARSSGTVSDLVIVADEGNFVRRIIFWVLGAFAASSLYMRKARLRISGTGTLGWLIIAFQVWAFTSLAWSEAPSVSLRRLGLFAMLWLAAFDASQRFRVRDITLWVFVSAACYLNIGLVAEIVLGTFRPLSSAYRFAGMVHPNTQGMNCALLLFASLFLWSGERQWRVVFALFACEAFAFLLLTKSRTSTGSALLAVPIVLFLTSRRSRKFIVVLSAGAATCLGLLFADFIAPYIQQAAALGRVDPDNITLTGRIPLWEQTFSYIVERPFKGYGYDAFWTPRHLIDFSLQQGWTVPNAHSTYLDITLGLGLIGGVLYILIIAVGIRRTVMYRDLYSSLYYQFLGAVLVFVLLAGTAESIVFYGTPLTFLVMLIVCALSFSKPVHTQVTMKRSAVLR